MMNDARPYITIVTGLPRSGTSMMMQMIDRGGIEALVDNIRTADEDNPKGYYEFEPVKKTKQDASWVPTAVGKVVKLVHLLLLDLPLDQSYRVVFMRRNLDEVIKSQNIMLDRGDKGGGELPADKIIAVFKSQLDKVYRYLAEHDNFEMLEVNYNDMLAGPQPIASKINNFLGDSLDEKAMLGVIDPTLYRNRA